jgi:hypothetical protein
MGRPPFKVLLLRLPNISKPPAIMASMLPLPLALLRWRETWLHGLPVVLLKLCIYSSCSLPLRLLQMLLPLLPATCCSVCCNRLSHQQLPTAGFAALLMCCCMVVDNIVHMTPTFPACSNTSRSTAKGQHMVTTAWHMASQYEKHASLLVCRFLYVSPSTGYCWQTKANVLSCHNSVLRSKQD